LLLTSRSAAPPWEQDLSSGLATLTGHLEDAGYRPALADHGHTVAATGLEPRELVIAARLKDTTAIVVKMRRFGELR
jgi:hypothetical protein